MQVDAIDALHTLFVERKVELIEPLRNEVWGMREFGIQTIDGHRMMSGETTEAS